MLVVSGACGLIYEVVWSRVLALSFGTTQVAISTVLATYMAGLGMGSAAAARLAPRIKRPLLVYGILEVVIGIYALAVSPLLYDLRAVYGFLGAEPSGAATTFFQVVLTVAALLVPTACMGATLPVLSKALVTPKEAGSGSGKLYAANTVGAVVGALSAGFLLIGWLGLAVTVQVTAALSVGVGVAAAALHLAKAKRVGGKLPGTAKKTAAETVLVEGPAARASIGGFSLPVFGAMLAAFLAGGVSLSNQVVWTRVLGIVLDGTVYGFSALLGSFLCGLALGSAVIARFVDKPRRSPWDLLTALHVAAGVAAAVAMAAMPTLPGLAARLFSGSVSPYVGFSIKTGLVFLVVLLPTFFYGAIFPVTVRLAALALSPPEALGRVFAYNTAGCIVGSLAGGIFLPSFGFELEKAGLLAVSMSFVAALTVAWVGLVHRRVWASPASADRSGDTKRSGWKLARPWVLRFGVPLGALGLVLVIQPGFGLPHLMASRYAIEDYPGKLNYEAPEITGTKSKGNLVFLAEGKQTVVTIRQGRDGGFRLRNNGLNEAYHGRTEPHYAEVIFYLGALPYMLHPRPRHALLIGLGSGGTAETLTRTDLHRIDVVELEPEVVRASQFIYAQVEGSPDYHPLSDPRARLVVDDARNALLRWQESSRRAYDLIVSQPSHPWLAGMSYLYTKEHFQLVRSNLSPDGLFCQWINLFRMDGTGLRSILAAFRGVFSSAYVFQPDKSSLLLVGSKKPFFLDPRIIGRHLEEKRLSAHASLFGVELADVLLTHRLDTRRVDEIIDSARPNSDRLPIVEMRLPWIGHDAELELDEVVARSKVSVGLEPSNLAPTTSTPALWSDLAVTLVERAGREEVSVERARRFVEKHGARLGLEKQRLLARLALLEGDESEAIRLLSEAATRRDLAAAYRLGALLVERGELKRGIASLRLATRGAFELEAQSKLAEAYLELGMPGEAKRAVEPLVDDMDREYPSRLAIRAMLLLSKAERGLGAQERAMELALLHLDHDELSAEGHYQAGGLLELAGDREEARTHYRMGAELEKDLARDLDRKGRRAAANGHLRVAARYFRRAVEADPTSMSPYEWMSRAYREAGEYRRMEAVLAESTRNPFVDGSSWRKRFLASATLAERLGAAIAAETVRIRSRMEEASPGEAEKKVGDKPLSLSKGSMR